MKELEIRVPQVPGASMGNPAHGKGHEEGGDMQRRDQASWGPPGTSRASPSKPESVCLIIL